MAAVDFSWQWLKTVLTTQNSIRISGIRFPLPKDSAHIYPTNALLLPKLHDSWREMGCQRFYPISTTPTRMNAGKRFSGGSHTSQNSQGEINMSEFERNEDGKIIRMDGLNAKQHAQMDSVENSVIECWGCGCDILEGDYKKAIGGKYYCEQCAAEAEEK
jgi:hypothetical protein